MTVMATAGLALSGSASAASFVLVASDYWGDNRAGQGWYNEDLNEYGMFPGSSDDARSRASCDGPGGAPCSNLRMEYTTALGGGPVSATVRTFDGAGRRLDFGPGSYLWATNGGQVSGIAMNGGTFIAGNAYADPFIISRIALIEWGGALNPSVIGGNPLLLGDTTVQGTLELRNGNSAARVTNQGVFTQSGTYGNTTLFFDMDFRNEAGGVVDLQNDNGLQSEPTDGDPARILFYNDVGATLSKTGGSGTSTVEMAVVNAGTIAASSGRLALGGGGTHADSTWLTTDTGVLQLLGDHVINGTVTSSTGAGVVEIGYPGSPASLTIADGGVLANHGFVYQYGAMTVAAGGRVENDSQQFLVANTLTIDAGGELVNKDAGNIQITGDGTIANGGDLTLLSGTVYGNGAYVQSGGAATTLIDTPAAILLGPGSSYLQENGSTTVRGSLEAETVRFQAGQLRGNGSINASVLQIDAGVVVGPGNSPGRLTVNGNVDAIGAIFDIEIAGLDAGLTYDQLYATGDINFDGGEVRFRFTDGYLPGVDDVFQWVLTDGALNGLETLNFLVSSDAGLVDGYLDGSGQFVVSSVSAVPLPASVWLLATGLAAVVARPRRRNGGTAALH
ncbi:MAG: VPLPA-CTERM sorting domain-containing protein [Chromatiales bacterium]|nr:VPLPA-CTERM sorting domain-containing protein [Chromatiales bacterium]